MFTKIVLVAITYGHFLYLTPGLSQPLNCSPCGCFHKDGVYEFNINCQKASIAYLDWTSILRLNLDIVIADTDYFNFDMIPADVKPLVVNLTIRNTEMADLDGSGFEFLENLYIDNVTVTNEAFHLMPISLKKLRIRNSKLTISPIRNDHQLQKLDFSGNNLKTIPISETLTELNMANNGLFRISTDFCNPMTLLTVINLSQNQLTDLAEDFLECIVTVHKLGLPLTIDLSKNSIRTIHERAFAGLNIEKIDLSNNKLKYLPSSLLDWAGLKSFDLQYNPWACECNNQWLLDTIVPILYNTSQKRLHNFRCATPKNYIDKPLVFWLGRSEDVFCSKPASTAYLNGRQIPVFPWNPSTISSLILGIIIIILLISLLVVCLQRRRIRNRRQSNRQLIRDSYPTLGFQYQQCKTGPADSSNP